MCGEPIASAECCVCVSGVREGLLVCRGADLGEVLADVLDPALDELARLHRLAPERVDTLQLRVRQATDGACHFNALPPAPYRLTAEHEGFTKKVLEHVQIIPEQLNALDLQLDVGQIQTTVTVSDTTQALDTETATVSGTVTSNQIEHMPSFGRDVFQLIQLAPGVFGDGAQGSGGNGQSLPGTQGPGGSKDGRFR